MAKSKPKAVRRNTVIDLMNALTEWRDTGAPAANVMLAIAALIDERVPIVMAHVIKRGSQRGL